MNRFFKKGFILDNLQYSTILYHPYLLSLIQNEHHCILSQQLCLQIFLPICACPLQT